MINRNPVDKTAHNYSLHIASQKSAEMEREVKRERLNKEDTKKTDSTPPGEQIRCSALPKIHNKRFLQYKESCSGIYRFGMTGKEEYIVI